MVERIHVTVNTAELEAAMKELLETVHFDQPVTEQPDPPPDE